eukprot:9492362-Pyramimonas_sp.AAC.1
MRLDSMTSSQSLSQVDLAEIVQAVSSIEARDTFEQNLSDGRPSQHCASFTKEARARYKEVSGKLAKAHELVMILPWPLLQRARQDSETQGARARDAGKVAARTTVSLDKGESARPNRRAQAPRLGHSRKGARGTAVVREGVSSELGGGREGVSRGSGSAQVLLRRKLPCPYGRVVGSPRWAAG